MKLRPWLITLSLLTIPTILSFFSGCSSNTQTADLIVYNGKVIIVDADDTVAEAMAIRGEKILRVGSDDEILALKDSATEVIDLEGKAVLPGLIDSHTHPAGASMFEVSIG